MGLRILFNRDYRICLLEDGRESEFDSEYVQNNLRSRRQLKDRDLWKKSGPGARFLGEEREELPPMEISLNGFAGVTGDEILYSVSVNEISAIYKKDLADPEPDSEQHILHGYARRTRGLDYDRKGGRLVTAASEDGLTYQITILDLATGEDRTLTDGDIAAGSPSFTGRGTILFDCALVGRDANGNIAGFSNNRIFELDLGTLEAEERKTDEKRNLLCPKSDAEGNLYYLSRPPAREREGTNLFLDIVLFPYRLLKAFVNFLNFFSVSYGGENLRGRGGNPARSVQKGEKELFIEGNRIDAEKNLRANAKGGNKYPGILPKTWQLVRQGPDGAEQALASGVLAYDVDQEGRVVYSNGRHLFALENGEERYLCACGLATVVRLI